MARERTVYAILCGVIAIWGLNVVMIKYLSFFPPLLIAAIRMSVAAVVLSPVLVAFRGKGMLTQRAWLYIAGVALTSITLHQILIAYGVKYTTASNASLLLGLNPLATALLAVPVLGEPLTWRKVAGIACGFGGVLLVVLANGKEAIGIQGWGDLLVFVSMLMYVVGGLLIRKVTMLGVPVLMVTALSHMLAAVWLWLAAAAALPAEDFVHMDTRPFTWGVILTSGILATGLGTLGWNYGIRQLGASRTAIFLNGMPLASLVFAALLLGEPLKWLQGLALLLIVAGVYLGSRRPETGQQKLSVAATTSKT